MIRTKSAVLWVVLLWAGLVAAEPPAAPDLPRLGTESDETHHRGLLGGIDRTHEAWSHQVMEIGVWLDRLFGGEEFVPDRSSYVRLRTTALLREGDSEVEPRLRARITLPNTERRLSLMLESEDEERFDRGAGQEPGPPVLLRSPGDGGFTAGLRYLSQLWDVVDLDTDAGVRLRSGLPDPFVRARIRRAVQLDGWELRPLQELYWREQKGAGARFQLIVQRPLGGARFFRSISEVDWVHRERSTYYAQDLVFSHALSRLNAVQAVIGVRGESHPQRVESWFVNIGWRRNIYKDWLFAEVRPELLFERDADFQAEPRLFLTLEAYFGNFR